MKVLIFLALLGMSWAADEPVDRLERVKQNFHTRINGLIDQQITMELQASYLYQAYSHYFGRSDVALPGFAKWFEKASKEERDHATGLIEYVNKRGGSVVFKDIHYSALCGNIADEITFVFSDRQVPCICYFMSQKKDKLGKSTGCPEDRMNWKNGLWAMQDALTLERMVNSKLLSLHSSAGDELTNDPHLSHILEHDYLDEQVDAIKTLGDYIRQLERVDSGLGEYLFDKNLE